ncbi:MarR family transcriptional regulator, partial [Klebsiella variicola]|uniref:MarR family transcriptional regulator n=2 Tax=Klebsiella/Raoultella group TaxID=2890311 RepID=UPI001C63F0C1
SSMAKKNKTLTITEKKDVSYKSIKDGVEYVHLFPRNLKALIKEYGLTTNELLVLTEIMESMLSHGNLLINFSQKRLCELTGINKSTMSKVFTTLKNKKCLIETNDNTYLNSVIFMKGLPQKLFIQYRDHFLKSIEYKLSSDEYFEEIFDDKFIETYQKSLEGIKDKKKQMQKAEKEKALKNFQKKVSEEENLALFPNEWQELDDAS